MRSKAAYLILVLFLVFALNMADELSITMNDYNHQKQPYHELGYRISTVQLTSGLNITGQDVGYRTPMEPFSWSPNNEEIAFSAVDSTGYSHIFVVNITTGAVKKITNSTYNDFGAVWSPTGKYIFFYRDTGSSPGSGCNRKVIYRATPDGSEILQITTGRGESSITPSPTGSDFLAFSSCQNNDNGWYYLWTMNYDGSNQTLIADHGTGHNIAISPDGSKIAYEQRSYWNEPSQIYLINSDGTNDTKLYTSFISGTTYEWSTIGWSPDGKEIIFTDGRYGSRDIFEMYLSNRTVVDLTNNTAEDVFTTALWDEVWNPTTGRIVYISNESGYWEVWTINPYTKERKQITDNQLPKITALWSHNGNYIAYAGYKDNIWNLYLITVHSNATNVPSAPQNLQARAGNRYVNLTWSVPADDGGSAITEYRIYRNGSLIATVPASQLWYNDTNVSNGVSYTYYVTAVNSVGESERSNEVSAEPMTVPTAPRNLRANAGNRYVNLTWSVPADDGGSAITEYRIYRNGTLIATVPASQLWYNDTNVSNGVSYKYYVTAVNSVGEGDKSIKVLVTPSGSVPEFSPAFIMAVLLLAALAISLRKIK